MSFPCEKIRVILKQVPDATALEQADAFDAVASRTRDGIALPVEPFATYTIRRSQSAQMFCPGGNTFWSCAGCGFVSGADTCRKPDMEFDGLGVVGVVGAISAEMDGE